MPVVDHYRHLERFDRLEERMECAVVDGIVAHDRMKVKAEHAEVFDRVFGFADRVLTLERIDGAPGVNDAFGMALLHRGNVIVGTRRGVDGRFEIERHQHGLDAGIGKVLHHRGFVFRHPAAAPVLRQRVDVGLLARDPFLGVGIAVEVDDAHVNRRPSSPTPSPPDLFWTPSRRWKAGNRS
jgi:hypothetical protein